MLKASDVKARNFGFPSRALWLDEFGRVLKGSRTLLVAWPPADGSDI